MKHTTGVGVTHQLVEWACLLVKTNIDSQHLTLKTLTLGLFVWTLYRRHTMTKKRTVNSPSHYLALNIFNRLVLWQHNAFWVEASYQWVELVGVYQSGVYAVKGVNERLQNVSARATSRVLLSVVLNQFLFLLIFLSGFGFGTDKRANVSMLCYAKLQCLE